MKVVRSKRQQEVRYVFESQNPQPSAEEISRQVGSAGIESTLTLSRKHAPFGVAEYSSWREIMADCADPEIKDSFDESYDSLMRCLAASGVAGEPYRIHKARIASTKKLN